MGKNKMMQKMLKVGDFGKSCKCNNDTQSNHLKKKKT